MIQNLYEKYLITPSHNDILIAHTYGAVYYMYTIHVNVSTKLTYHESMFPICNQPGIISTDYLETRKFFFVKTVGALSRTQVLHRFGGVGLICLLLERVYGTTEYDNGITTACESSSEFVYQFNAVASEFTSYFCNML